jgi:hypothetical protein
MPVRDRRQGLVAAVEKSLRHDAFPQESAAMPIEAALIKPVVDALMGLFRQGENLRLKHNAEAALREAIRELLLASPDDNKAEARIAIAKAAGILSEDVVLAEDMLKKHRATKTRTSGKAATGRKRKPASATATAKTDQAAPARAAKAAPKTAAKKTTKKAVKKA